MRLHYSKKSAVCDSPFIKKVHFLVEDTGNIVKEVEKIDIYCVRNTQNRGSSFSSTIDSCAVSSEGKEREGQVDCFFYRPAFTFFSFFSDFGFSCFSSFLKSIFSSPMSWETVTPKWEESLRRVLIRGSSVLPNRRSEREELGTPECLLKGRIVVLFKTINLFKGSVEKVISFLLDTVCCFGLSVFNRFSISLKSIFSSPMSWDTVISKYREILTNELNLGSIVLPLKILCNKESSIEILDAKEQRLDGYKSNNFFREVGLNKLFLSFPLDMTSFFPDNTGIIINNTKDFLCRGRTEFTTLHTKKPSLLGTASSKELLKPKEALKSSSSTENSSLLFVLGQDLPVKRRRG